MDDSPGASDLFAAAVGDLADGKEQLAAALGDVRAAVRDPALLSLIDRLIAGLDRQIERLSPGVTGEGQPCLWMEGIIADAQRDAETQPEGRLCDIALAGALRKAAAASRVSTETALLLAPDNAAALIPALALNHGEERLLEAALGNRIAALLHR